MRSLRVPAENGSTGEVERLAITNSQTTLAFGLEVDLEALPARQLQTRWHGRVDLDNPAVTSTLLKLNAVIEVARAFDRDGSCQAVGVACAEGSAEGSSLCRFRQSASP